MLNVFVISLSRSVSCTCNHHRCRGPFTLERIHTSLNLRPCRRASTKARSFIRLRGAMLGACSRMLTTKPESHERTGYRKKYNKHRNIPNTGVQYSKPCLPCREKRQAGPAWKTSTAVSASCPRRCPLRPPDHQLPPSQRLQQQHHPPCLLPLLRYRATWP